MQGEKCSHRSTENKLDTKEEKEREVWETEKQWETIRGGDWNEDKMKATAI